MSDILRVNQLEVLYDTSQVLFGLNLQLVKIGIFFYIIGSIHFKIIIS